jgi:hypothetical protein
VGDRPVCGDCGIGGGYEDRSINVGDQPVCGDCGIGGGGKK